MHVNSLVLARHGHAKVSHSLSHSLTLLPRFRSWSRYSAKPPPPPPTPMHSGDVYM
jgi:hypothetical protein